MAHKNRCVLTIYNAFLKVILPLDRLSIKQEDHFHLLNYGFSNLYEHEEEMETEYSAYEFELTFHIKIPENKNKH